MPKRDAIHRKHDARKYLRTGWELHLDVSQRRQQQHQQLSPAHAVDHLHHVVESGAFDVEDGGGDGLDAFASRRQVTDDHTEQGLQFPSLASHTDDRQEIACRKGDQGDDRINEPRRTPFIDFSRYNVGASPSMQGDFHGPQHRSTTFLQMPNPLLGSCYHEVSELSASAAIPNPFLSSILTNTTATMTPASFSLKPHLFQYFSDHIIREWSKYRESNSRCLAATDGTAMATLPYAIPLHCFLQPSHEELSRLQCQQPCHLSTAIRASQQNQGNEPMSFNLLQSIPMPVHDLENNHKRQVEFVCNPNMSMQASMILSYPEDRGMLNENLIFLRQQIEFFQATLDDIMSHTRGRNKGVALQQVGVRCRHCNHIPAGQRRKGSTYFPSTLMGIYQAAQNINCEHLQSGLCSEMPRDVERKLLTTRATKTASSGAGKAYWAEAARMQGLIDTDDGIRFAAFAAGDVAKRILLHAVSSL